MKNILIWLIKTYQLIISPLFPPACRFIPTCSQYAIDAIRTFGAVRGLFFATRRLLRCHPLHQGGFDPVPAAGKERRGRAGSSENMGLHPDKGIHSWKTNE